MYCLWFFFFKQKTAYEMRISDWSSDVCSSDLLGPSAQIGVTCHDSRHFAMEAGDAGADYVAFGSFYPTTTKDVRHRADPARLSWWASMFELPCVTLGGSTHANVRLEGKHTHLKLHH